MKISEIIDQLSLTIFNAGDTSKEITGGYSSDLLSDVMGNAEEGCVWVTLQTHRNVAAISALKEIGAVIIVKGQEPDENTLEHAKDEGITLLGTSEETFEMTGKIYALLNA
ncbi:MAG: serine kinase [Bacteroidales bacterium]|jgi:predicted transcriptional regulator|nr:serine kinase [Bacteroidales bacterium]